MATFISHPLFGAGAAYILCQSQSKHISQRFIFLSLACQWLPDIDTLSYLFPIDEHHPLGHRGLTHSVFFAFILAFGVMSVFYRSRTLSRLQWWKHYIWFFLITLSHGLFDGLVHSSLGVAYFWPIDAERYMFAWQPLMDVPIQFSELFSARFWQAQWIECQFFSFILASIFVIYQLQKSNSTAPHLPSSTPIETADSQSASHVNVAVKV